MGGAGRGRTFGSCFLLTGLARRTAGATTRAATWRRPRPRCGSVIAVGGIGFCLLHGRLRSEAGITRADGLNIMGEGPGLPIGDPMSRSRSTTASPGSGIVRCAHAVDGCVYPACRRRW